MTPATVGEMRREVTAMLEYARAYRRWLDVRYGWEPDELEAPAVPDGPPRPPTPSLDAWQRRVRAGAVGEDPARPSTWRWDALYAAARWEQSAANAWRGGCTVKAIASDLDRAEYELAQRGAA